MPPQKATDLRKPIGRVDARSVVVGEQNPFVRGDELDTGVVDAWTDRTVDGADIWDAATRDAFLDALDGFRVESDFLELIEWDAQELLTRGVYDDEM